MRTLHADLTTAQRSTSAPIYTQIVLTSTAAVVTTYTTADTPNLIFGVESDEQQYSGRAVVQLDNSAGTFNSLNFVGQKIQIGWGFTCAGAVNRYSNIPDMWVVSQTEVSRFGRLLTELVCYDIWNMIGEGRVFAGAVKLTGTVTKSADYNPIGQVLTQTATGASGTITHYKSTEILVSNVSGAFAAGTATVGAYLSISLTSVTVLSSEAGGAKQYAGNTHIQDIISALLSDWVAAPTLDSDDTGTNYATYMPFYNVYVDAKLSTVIQEMLDFTECGMRMRDGVMHVLYLNPAPVSADYTYDGVHNIAGCDRTRQLNLPNRIYVIDRDPYDASPTYKGSYADATSYAALGKYLSAVVVAPSITSDVQATALATSIINRGKQAISSGSIILPMMNVGEEVLDWVTLTDARNSDLAISGRVGRIVRKLDNGKYSMVIELGGLKMPANFRSYPSPMTPVAIGQSDLIQELILATTIWAGYGKVKLSSDGIGVVGDVDDMGDAMIKFASTSGDLSTTTCCIWHYQGQMGINSLDDFTIATGGEIILTSAESKITRGGVDIDDAVQSNVTSYRVLDTDYQNTSGRAKIVNVQVYHYGVADAYAYVSASNPPADYMAYREHFGLADATHSTTIHFVVPNNYYYRVGPNTNTVVKWTEWTLG